MSDIFDENIDLRSIDRQFRRFNRQNLNPVPRHLNQLPVPITPNQPFDDTDYLNGERIISDYFKIDLRNSSDCILLNTTLYHRLARLIHNRYGEFPLHGSLVCSSIIILPKPDCRCSLYYCSGHNDRNGYAGFQPI